MPFATYRLRRSMLLFWRWEAEAYGQPAGRGLSLSQRGGRWAARNCLRSQRDLRAQQNEKERSEARLAA